MGYYYFISDIERALWQKKKEKRETLMKSFDFAPNNIIQVTALESYSHFSSNPYTLT